MMQQNVNVYDRMLRVLLGTSCILIGYFWLGGAPRYVLLVLGILLFATGSIGYCILYRMFGRKVCATSASPSKLVWALFMLLYGALIVAGPFLSVRATTAQFLESFNTMNGAYKQALFQTGQQNRDESQAYYRELVRAHASFADRYRTYRPFALRHDTALEEDISTIGTHVLSVSSQIESADGDLQNAHLKLEEIRPILQGILKRNNFSMLAVALVDFHDAMEAVLEPATLKDASGVLAAYAKADISLRAVEAEASDDQIRAIRSNLEALKTAAEAGQTDSLPVLGSTLKSSFVRVYLARG